MQRLRWIYCAFCVTAATLGFSQAANAELIWNGFASVYATKALTEKNYGNSVHQKDDVGYAQLSKVGLNLRSDFEQDWAAIAQVTANGSNVLDDAGRWTPVFDWFFLSYIPNNQWSFKFGRQLYGAYTFSEYVDVGAVYPWPTPPLEMLFAGPPIKSINGLSATYQIEMFGQSSLAIRALHGSDVIDFESGGYLLKTEVNDMWGLQLSWTGDGWALQAGATRARVEFTETISAIPLFTASHCERHDALTVDGKFDKYNFVVYGGYAQAMCDGSTPTSTGGPTLNYTDGYFGTLGYRIRSVLPYFTYSAGAVDSGWGPRSETESYLAGLNYQIAPTLVAKSGLWWQRVEGGAGTGGDAPFSAEGLSRSVFLGVDFIF